MRRITKKKKKNPIEVSRRSKPHKKDHESQRNLVIWSLNCLVPAPDSWNWKLYYWKKGYECEKLWFYIKAVDLLDPSTSWKGLNLARTRASYRILSKYQLPNNINVDKLRREQSPPLQQAHNTMFETKLNSDILEIKRLHCSTTAERLTRSTLFILSNFQEASCWATSYCMGLTPYRLPPSLIS